MANLTLEKQASDIWVKNVISDKEYDIQIEVIILKIYQFERLILWIVRSTLLRSKLYYWIIKQIMV